MKVFTNTQRYFAAVGICSSNEPTRELALNNRILFGFSLFGLTIACQFMFILYVADDFMEYMDCGCSLSATITMFVCFAADVTKRATLFGCIHNIERLIAASESAFKSFKRIKFYFISELTLIYFRM